jgi:very-short-patch-repair endonuclease/energy-coupling factor transporter ATP-binding protein EcfA2
MTSSNPVSETASSQTTPQARRLARIALLGDIEYPADLPVVLRREDLAKVINDHQVVIVCGETGSGKTTQLPKICLSIGRGVQGAIAHTQPRRVAARTVASRIAFELKTELGGTVGYKIRFNDRVSVDTCIKLMTDGILLAEIHSDPLLKKYDTIIIDEAHERSLNIDFLLGYFRQILPRRPDLKLIITSATLDAERFSRHFETPLLYPLLNPPQGGEGTNEKGIKALILPRREREYTHLSPKGEADSATVFVTSPPGGGLGRGLRKERQAVHHAVIPEELLTHARELRKNATDAENLLWQLLRRNQLMGLGFRRQHPLGSYILDFYCHQAKLVIELDGGQHAEGAQVAYDEARTLWLKQQDINVLRFWNHEVLTNTEGVLQAIYEKLQTSSLLKPPP